TGRPPGPGDLRLIVRDQPMSLAAHLAHYGPVPLQAAGSAALIAEVERAGLTGRGGGAFPAGRKLRAVADAAGGRGTAVVVANGSESEPASSKDAVLLTRSPHLVLDGIALAGEAIGAARAYLCVGSGGGLARSLRDAAAERDQAGLSRVAIEVSGGHDGYLAGQETALVSVLNGGRPRPAFVPPRPSDKGVRRQPTLVLNVETLAHVALIARYGAAWFRSIGRAESPGSALVTVTGAVTRPGVREIPLGAPLEEVLRRSGLDSPAQAVLAGGYFGTWLPLPAALGVPVSEPGLRAAGASLGSGVLAVLPGTACGLAETARVTGFLASQIADQCGPCRNGMPALAEAMNWIAFGQPDADIIGWARQLTELITGRGACHLPDGTAGLVTSALAVFAAELRAHARAGPCERTRRPAILPIPPSYS
ncbi:MAG: NADH-ubiquinone oxidoreductase-F iron-sulfur binding region domain-containing protein, partial [Streptosporangiaceae bacterium]